MEKEMFTGDDWLTFASGTSEEEKAKVKEALRISEETSNETRRILDEFNEILREKGREAYVWLREQVNRQQTEFFQKYGYRLNNDFMYLYPERISIGMKVENE